MLINRARTARLVVAYLTATVGGTGASGTTTATTVVPEKEPPKVITEVKEETGGTDLESQVTTVIDEIEKGEEDVKVTVTLPEKETETSVVTETEEKTEVTEETSTAEMDNSARATLAAVAKKRAIRGNNTSSGTTQGSNTNSETTNISNTEVTVSAEAANSGTASQAAIVDEMLKTYPSGTDWGASVTYKNNSGCAAYAFMMLDKVYGTTDNAYVQTTGGSEVRQYSVIQVENGTHWAFVLEVNDDNTVRVAEANVNSSVYIGGIYDIKDIVCVVNR